MEAKVSMTIILPGRTLSCKYSETENVSMTIFNKISKKKEIIHTKLKQPVDAHQNLHLNDDAYKYMTCDTSCVGDNSPAKWKTMSKKKRLEAHLNEICESLGGKSFTYEVLAD